MSIGRSKSLLPWSEFVRNICPNTNTDIANGRVSSNGALLDTSPSLFIPLRLLKKEPVESPTKLVNPRKLPTMKALAAHPVAASVGAPGAASGAAPVQNHDKYVHAEIIEAGYRSVEMEHSEIYNVCGLFHHFTKNVDGYISMDFMNP